MSEQPNVVLVHGAWADGSSWSAVIESLQTRGYTVTAPQLPETSLADDVARLDVEPGVVDEEPVHDGVEVRVVDDVVHVAVRVVVHPPRLQGEEVAVGVAGRARPPLLRRVRPVAGAHEKLTICRTTSPGVRMVFETTARRAPSAARASSAVRAPWSTAGGATRAGLV